jgi:hypothetical protein
MKATILDTHGIIIIYSLFRDLTISIAELKPFIIFVKIFFFLNFSEKKNYLEKNLQVKPRVMRLHFLAF